MFFHVKCSDKDLLIPFCHDVKVPTATINTDTCICAVYVCVDS